MMRAKNWARMRTAWPRNSPTLGQMEASLEELRPQILSDLTRDLLEAAQERFQKKRRT